jgi:hypothetical protein
MAYVTSNKVDEQLDFNKLVIKQMDRCNVALTKGGRDFTTAIIGFRCMLSHLIQRDDRYKEDMKAINGKQDKQNNSVQNVKLRQQMSQRYEFEAAVEEYQALVRLCARHNLFPLKRGELTTDEDD